jgi:hypothetical protein
LKTLIFNLYKLFYNKKSYIKNNDQVYTRYHLQTLFVACEAADLLVDSDNFNPLRSGHSYWLQIQGFRVRFSPTKKKVVGLERGPLSLVSTTEELLDRKVAAPVCKTENTAVEIRHADQVPPSICKSWQSLRQAAVARSV